MDSNYHASGGIGFFGLLGIAFIILKLVGKINWPWIWVLCPIWGSIILGIILIITGLIIAHAEWGRFLK